MPVMAKKKMRQLAFRVPEDEAAELERTARKLGLDLSNFLRMLVAENLAPYKRRADQIEGHGRDES